MRVAATQNHQKIHFALSRVFESNRKGVTGSVHRQLVQLIIELLSKE